MILVRAGFIRIFFKAAACLGLTFSVLVCFLVSYSWVSGDREDREDMQRTFASLGKKASFVQTSYAGDREIASERGTDEPATH